MRRFSRNECTLDTISIAEHCANIAHLNWVAFLLNELYEACKYVYRRRTKFIFLYLIITLEMWKWFPPPLRDLVPVSEGQPSPTHIRHGECWETHGENKSTRKLSRNGMLKCWGSCRPLRGFPGHCLMNIQRSSSLGSHMATPSLDHTLSTKIIFKCEHKSLY